LSDNESLFDRILTSSSKEYKGQSANPTQAIRKLYECDSTEQRDVDDIEPCEIQPTDEGYSSLTSHSSNDSSLELEPFTEQEIHIVGDIVMDQASAYAEVWINEAHFVLELRLQCEIARTESGAIFGVIARLIGFVPTVQHSEARVLEIEDSLSEDDFDNTPRESYNHCPGYFAPVSESDADSIFADNGSCLSDGVHSRDEAPIRKLRRNSFRSYGLPIASGFNQRKHPAFRTNCQKDAIRNLTDDAPYIFDDTKAPHGGLFDGGSAHRNRGNAASIQAEIGEKYPASYSSFGQDGSNTQRTLPQSIRELPALFASDEADGRSRGIRGSTARCSAIPDSPTLGGNSKRVTWYAGSLTCSEERFLTDEEPTLAPSCFTPWSNECQGHPGNEIFRSSSSQSHHHTNLDLQASFSRKADRALLLPPPEIQHAGAGSFFDRGLLEHDDLDDFFGARSEDEDDGASDHGFSEAFLSSPLCPRNDRNAPRGSSDYEALPENIVTVRTTKATQDFAEALDDDDTATCDGIATSTCENTSQVRISSFGTLRAYRRKDVPRALQVSKTSRTRPAVAPLILGSPCGAQPTSRPRTPTDMEVNHYLQKTARPNTQTALRSRRRTNQSYEPDYAVNVTTCLDPENSPERIGTFPSTFDLQPQSTPLRKKLAQKVSLSVITSKEPSPKKSPSAPNTPKTTPTKKKSGIIGSWGRKGSLTTELCDSPCTLSGATLKDSPPSGQSSFCRTPLTGTTFGSSQSPRSPLQIIPETQSRYPPPPQRTAPRTPLDEIPPLPPRDPRRLASTQSSTNFVLHSNTSTMSCNTIFPELQRESMLFFNQLDPNARKFYAEQKVSPLESNTGHH